MNSRIAQVVAVATTVGALAVLPAEAGAVTAHAASSKTISISLHAHITSSATSTKGHGAITGTLPGTYTADVTPAQTKYVLKVSGGRIDISAKYQVNGTALTGKWHTTGGSGKYKHVKGSGKTSATLSTNTVFKLTGKLTY